VRSFRDILCLKAAQLVLYHMGMMERGGFPLSSSYTVMHEQLVQDRYTVA